MENIEVAVRLRPVNQRELQLKEESVWQVESNHKTISMSKSGPLSPLLFQKESSSMSGLNTQ